MSIYYSGTLKRSAGIVSAISKQVKLINLKPVKKIEVQFDPFHLNAVTARDFLFHITNAKVIQTNLGCVVKPFVVCDRSEPEIRISLVNSGTVKFLASNLTALEILQQFNKHISSTVSEEPTETVVSSFANQKKKGKGKGKK